MIRIHKPNYITITKASFKELDQTLVCADVWLMYSLVPGLPRFDLPFAFTIIRGIGRSTKIKTEKGIHHVSGREVDVVGEGPIFKYIRSKLESEFLNGQDE